MDNVIILATDNNYINHIKYNINNIRDRDNTYDICVIFDEKNEEFITNQLKDFKVILKPIKSISDWRGPFGIKYHIFDVFFKQWKKILYIDCDTVVYSNLNKLFDLVSDDKKMFVDYETNTIKNFFTMWTNRTKENDNKFKELDDEKLIDVNSYGFNTGIMIFSSEIIDNESVKKLYNTHEKYLEINNHGQNGKPSDQPIINIVFGNYCNQVPKNYFCFWKSTNQDTLISHFCRWEAPWGNHTGHSNLGSGYSFNRYYYEMLNKKP